MVITTFLKIDKYKVLVPLRVISRNVKTVYKIINWTVNTHSVTLKQLFPCAFLELAVNYDKFIMSMVCL